MSEVTLVSIEDERDPAVPRKWHFFAKNSYLGTCITTEAEVRTSFPWSEIMPLSSTCNIFAPPPRRTACKDSKLNRLWRRAQRIAEAP